MGEPVDTPDEPPLGWQQYHSAYPNHARYGFKIRLLDGTLKRPHYIKFNICYGSSLGLPLTVVVTYLGRNGPRTYIPRVVSEVFL